MHQMTMSRVCSCDGGDDIGIHGRYIAHLHIAFIELTSSLSDRNGVRLYIHVLSRREQESELNSLLKTPYCAIPFLL